MPDSVDDSTAYILKDIWQHVDDDSKAAVHASISCLLMLQLQWGSIGYATGCSGCEILASSVQTFFSVLGCMEFKWVHLWSCEIIRRKAEFLMDTWGIDVVLKDMESLVQDFAAAWWHEPWQRIMWPVFWSAGFSCKSVSGAHTMASRFRDCIAEGIGTTGLTFWYCHSFCRARRPVWIILENVRG